MSRLQVLRKYKELLFLCREYPLGYRYARDRLHRAFGSRKHLGSEGDIQRALARVDYMHREIEALYYLKRYRTLRQRYGAPDHKTTIMSS